MATRPTEQRLSHPAGFLRAHPHTPWPVWAPLLREALPSLTYVSWVFLSCDSRPSCHRIPSVTLGWGGWAVMSGRGGSYQRGLEERELASPGARLQGEGRWAGGPGEGTSKSPGGHGVRARYEVVGERMSKPADASHVCISSRALSPEFRAHKSGCLLPKPSLLISTPKSYSS